MKTLKQLEDNLVITQVCFGILYIFLIFSIIVLYTYYEKRHLVTNNSTMLSEIIITNISGVLINYDDLNDTDIKIATNIIDKLNAKYLKSQKLITFSYNISSFYGEGYENSVIGFNRNNEVFVKFRNNKIGVATTVCHELLHTYFNNDDASHEVLYDVASKSVCFDEVKNE